MSCEKLHTPCFIFDEHEFESSCRSFSNALFSSFDRIAIGLSVKTNSLPFLLEEAQSRGCMAEVVSHDEYRLASICGFPSDRIIYNGPMKSCDTFLEAIIGGGIVNIETKRELEWLKSLPVEGQYKVGLRLNINISKVSPKDADGGDDNSRFGFSEETGEFKEAVAHISSLPNVSLAGLHIHRTAHSRSPRFYRNSVAYAASVIRKYNLNLDYLDVGGGYFGVFPNKPTFEDYAAAIEEGIGEFKNIKIIVEPGNALVANCFSFLTEVIDTKKVDEDTVFVTTDGSRNDVDPFFHKTDYLKEIYRTDCERKVLPTQIVTGCSCLEYDRLFTLKDERELKVGDRILYDNVGAYTMTLSPLFIRYFPAVYAVDLNGECRIVRKPWSAGDLIRNDKELWNE